MSSKIEWTDDTWNPVAGCKDVHAGCANCYAKQLTARLPGMGQEAKYGGLVTIRDGTPRWTGEFRPWPAALDKPLKKKKGKRWFVNSMSDLFGEGVPFEFIAAVFAVMAATPQHRYVVLTKRPARALEWFAWYQAEVAARVAQATHNVAIGVARGNPIESYYRGAFLANHAFALMGNAVTLGQSIQHPLDNVAIGVSISDQSSADKCLPLLAQIPARWRIVSAEPLLGPVDMSVWIDPTLLNCCDTCGGNLDGDVCMVCQADHAEIKRPQHIDQVIIGAESGAKARPCRLEWIQDLAKQVLDAQDRTYAGFIGGVEVGERVTSGPALFVKQADVCEKCSGTGKARNFLGEPCGSCECAIVNRATPGQTGKLRKGCPALYVPGYGAQSWQQFPKGWL